MKIDELPRKAVLGYLELTRLPLTAAERALGKTEGTWPLTIAADRLQARMKDVAGSVLRDDTLRADAKLQNAALDERLRAVQAELEADRLAAKRSEAVQRGEQRERVVENQVAKKKAAARKVANAKDEAIEHRETNAKRETLAEESAAVREERAALEAKVEALELEDELEAVRAARKSS